MKNTCTQFEKILTNINEKGITSKNELMTTPELYEEYWLVANIFANFCLASKTTVCRAGKIKPGNAPKIEILEKEGITTKEDILHDAIVKLITILDTMIINKKTSERRTTEHQYNYAYNSINTLVDDQFKKLPPETFKFIPLNGTVSKNSHKEEGDDTLFEEIIGDNTDNPEHKLIECETINELTAILREKKEYERAMQRAKKEAERAEVLKELQLLSEKPAEVFVHMACHHLGLKPKAITSLILKNGVEKTYLKVLNDISKRYNLTTNEIRESIAGKRITNTALKADSDDPKTISAEVSRAKYRAIKALKKDK